MLVCEVAVGKQMLLREQSPDLSAAQVRAAGYDSVHGIRDAFEGTGEEEGFGGEPEPQSESDMQTEEFVVYDENQVIPRYVITYRTMATKTTDEVLESYALIRSSSVISGINTSTIVGAASNQPSSSSRAA